MRRGPAPLALPCALAVSSPEATCTGLAPLGVCQSPGGSLKGRALGALRSFWSRRPSGAATRTSFPGGGDAGGLGPHSKGG